MRKTVSLLCILCILISLSSCGLVGDQQYYCDVDEVESVQIVRLDEYVEGEYRYEYELLSEISDVQTFISRLNKLKHSVNWGDPMPMYTGDVVIKIDYRNGDYDLLRSNAQWFNRSGINNYGYFFFREEPFESLISDYIAE